MAMLSTEYNEALTGKVAERLGVKESLDKLSAGLGPSQTLGESAEAGIAAADKQYGQTISAARQQASAGVAQAAAEKQALSDPGTLSVGQKSYLGQGYDEQAARYRTAYDAAAEQAAATKKQAYANIYDTLNKSVNATSKQYTELMTALVNSSYGIAALQKAAGLNGVDTTGWFTTKGEEYRAAHNLVGVDSSKFGAEKQALMDDAALTWKSATIAADALESLGVYDTESEIGKLARYYLTNELYGAGDTWNQAWTQEERDKYLPILDAFRQDVLGYTQESFATEKEQRIQQEATAKEQATAAGTTRYAGQSELAKDAANAKSGNRIHLTYDGTKYKVKLGAQATGETLRELTKLAYSGSGHGLQVGDLTRIGDKLYVTLDTGTFEAESTADNWYRGWLTGGERDALAMAAGGGVAIEKVGLTSLSPDTRNFKMEGSVWTYNRVKNIPSELPENPIDGQSVYIGDRRYIYYEGAWWSKPINTRTGK